MQMFTKEMVKLSRTNLPALDFFEPVPELYGIEDEDFVAELRQAQLFFLVEKVCMYGVLKPF